MKTPRFRSLKALCLASTAVVAALPALAAESTAPTETIIVTAQRRAERLQDVPITISNVTAETMRQANVTNLADIAKVTAGVRFDARSSFYTPSIRGISTSIIFAGGGSNIGVYVDGFYSPSLQASDMQLMNVEGVSVLKGPQGTLFGRNTTGGAIQVTTSKPSQQTKAILEGAYGSYNTMRFQGYATTGLTDRIAGDVAVAYTKSDSFWTNDFTHNDKAGRYKNWSLRTGLNFDVSDNFSMIFRYSHSSKDDPSGLMNNVYIFQGVPACVACLSPGALTVTARGHIAADEQISYNYGSDAYQLAMNWDVGFANVNSYTQYRKDRGLQYYSLDYTNAAVIGISILNQEKTVTQEFLLTSKPGTRLQYTLGAFYFQSRQDFAYVGVAPAGVVSPRTPYPLSSRSGADNRALALYGDATYEVFDRLFVTAGLRWTHDNFADGYFQTVVGGVTNAPVYTNDLKTSRVTPRGVVRYQLTPDSNVYASVAKGYKGAIINVGGASTTPIRPESLWAYEVGYKYAGPQLSLNLSAYYMDYKDEQLQQSQLINGRPATIITNAASSELYGVDADVAYSLTDAFKVNIGAEYSHARYKHFPNGPAIGVTKNAAGVATAFPPIIIDLSGRPMAKAPDFTINVGAAYTVPVADGKLVLSGNLYYTSRFYFDLGAQVDQKPYALLDLRAEWTDPTDRYSIAVAGKNVTNTTYYIQAATNAVGVAGVYGAPATVEGSFRIKF